MSGFEVAGIALAVFPILVEGVQTIEHWRRYRVKLQDYTDIIGTQGVYYQDTLEELLSGIVQSEDEVTDFIAQPRGAIWSIPQYEEKLRQRLGRSYEVYMRLLENMVKALFSMCEKLGIDSSGKVLLDNPSRLEREIKRIKITLSRNILKEALSTIDKANKDLRDITHQNIYLEPIRKKRRSKRPLAELKVIRQYATSLHHVFITGKAWRCSCRMLHMASLRLESRAEALNTASDDAVQPKVKFRILLSTREERGNHGVISKYQEVEVIPSLASQVAVAISVTPQTSTRIVNIGPGPGSTTMAVSPEDPTNGHDCGSISDICSALCVSHQSRKAIGYLVDEEDDKHKHYLYRTNTMIGPETQSISLGDVLSGWHGSSKRPLLRSDRLQIAVTLASSVLQLDGTSWLKSEWSSEDIFFHDKSNRPTQSSYSYPYLSWKRCMTNVDTPGSFDTVSRETFAVRSKVLFALGITLIELCFGKKIADTYIPEDRDPKEAIYRLCGAVYHEMGSSYGDAVRRCLYQPFDVREIGLDNEEVQQKVFDEIVTPLSDDLNIFLGKSRT